METMGSLFAAACTENPQLTTFVVEQKTANVQQISNHLHFKTAIYRINRYRNQLLTVTD